MGLGWRNGEREADSGSEKVGSEFIAHRLDPREPLGALAPDDKVVPKDGTFLQIRSTRHRKKPVAPDRY